MFRVPIWPSSQKVNVKITNNLYACMALNANPLLYFMEGADINRLFAATLIFISGSCSAIPSAEQGKSGSIYNLVKNK